MRYHLQYGNAIWHLHYVVDIKGGATKIIPKLRTQKMIYLTQVLHLTSP